MEGTLVQPRGAFKIMRQKDFFVKCPGAPTGGGGMSRDYLSRDE